MAVLMDIELHHINFRVYAMLVCDRKIFQCSTFSCVNIKMKYTVKFKMILKFIACKCHPWMSLNFKHLEDVDSRTNLNVVSVAGFLISSHVIKAKGVPKNLCPLPPKKHKTPKKITDQMNSFPLLPSASPEQKGRSIKNVTIMPAIMWSLTDFIKYKKGFG